MWGAALLAACVSASLASCWLSGCCGVVWRVTRFGALAVATSAACAAIGLVVTLMAMTIYHFLYRTLVQ